MGLGRFLHTAERGVVGFQYNAPAMSQKGCRVLVPLSSGVRRLVYYYSFVSFIVGCAFNSLRAQLAYCSSMEVDWSCVVCVPRGIP